MLITFLLILSNLVGLGIAEYNASDLDEGGCVEFRKVKRINSKWMNEQGLKGWYFPILSSRNVNSWKMVLTGSPLASEDQLKDMCLKLMVTGTIITVTGYGNQAVFNCTRNRDGLDRKEKECHATQESTFPEVAEKAGESSMSIAWTDNKDYLVSVRCVNGQRIWALIASTPTLDHLVKEKVMHHVTQMGFNPEKAVFLSYKNC